MTLLSSQLMESLHNKQDDFKYLSNSALKVYQQFRQTLGELSLCSVEELQQQLQDWSYPGALPL